MIKNLKLKNFRNFENSEFFFSENKNVIIGENGKGKTNILEAISLFSGINLTKINFKNLVNKDKNIFYIETIYNGNLLAISFDKQANKKKFLINNKTTKEQNFLQNSFKTVFFSPNSMNIMYLSPSLRRDFLDNILINTFKDYKNILQKYKKILTSRNKILKNITTKKALESELNFWNKEFINIASFIYLYRFELINFLKEKIKETIQIFEGKIKNIELIYKTKIGEINYNLEKQEKLNLIKQRLQNLLIEKKEIELILQSTNFGPHLDDFEILVDNISLIDFASRGEVKSIILFFKFFEIEFIEKFTQKKPILLIDDLLSELDQKHKNLLIQKLDNYQTFITSIRKDYSNNINLIDLN